MKRAFCTVFLVLLAAGCAGGATLYKVDYASNYDPADFGYFNAEHGMRVIVLNNPSDSSKAEFGSALAHALEGRNYGAPIRFTADPASRATFDTRIIVLFAPERTQAAEALCRETSPEARPDPGSNAGTMLMVYCKYDKMHSTVTASGRLPLPIGGAAFNAYVGQAAQTLMDQAPHTHEISPG